MNENKENALHISPEAIDELRKVRAEMIQNFNDHRAGRNPLPAEQSLALRSHIATLTEFIEPGVKEMWPAYSAEEQAYLLSQSVQHQRDANNLAIGVLGPLLAVPAIVAYLRDKPPEVVSNLIEIGFNMTAAAGLKKVGLRNLHDRVLEPVSHPEVTARLIDTPPTSRTAANASYFDARPVTYLDDYLIPRATAQKHINSALNLLEDAQPLRTWLSNADLGTLFPIIDRYGGKNAMLSANKKSQVESGVSVMDWIDSYRQHPHAAKMVIEDAQRFVFRMLEDITSDRVLDPEKLKTVIIQLRAGEYMDAHEFAALYYVRQLAHTKFVESKVHDFLAMADIVKIKGQDRTNGITYVRERAELESPYGRLSEAQDRPPPASPESGQDR